MTIEAPASDVRMLLVQWGGDYREAYDRLTSSGEETYYAQRYSVETAGELARQYQSYGVLCLTGSGQSEAAMPNGVISLSAGIDPLNFDAAQCFAMIRRYRPTHLVLTTPKPAILRWALDQGMSVLPSFADTFTVDRSGLSWLRGMARSLRHWQFCHQLASVLNDPRIRWVGNHNINACRDLVRIGVTPHKVVPWDWPPPVRPEQYEPKSLAPEPKANHLLFVGTLTPSKGVGDAIEAVSELLRRGRPLKLRVLGGGDLDQFRRLAANRGVTDWVEFAGPRPHKEVMTALRDAAIAIVPSWHSYSEGLPFTIYESLATRTPIICSDHPAFENRVGNGRSAICVPQKSPVAIADAIEGLINDPERYQRMSEATGDTWSKLICPVGYYELIRRWASGTEDDERWLASHSLAADER